MGAHGQFFTLSNSYLVNIVEISPSINRFKYIIKVPRGLLTSKIENIILITNNYIMKSVYFTRH